MSLSLDKAENNGSLIKKAIIIPNNNLADKQVNIGFTLGLLPKTVNNPSKMSSPNFYCKSAAEPLICCAGLEH